MTIPRPHAQAEAARPDPFGKGLSLGHLIRSTLLYGLAGPPMGTAWYLISEMLDASESPDASLSLPGLLAGWLLFSIFSYRYGFFPALLTGLLLGLLPRQFPLVVLLPLAGIVGWFAVSAFQPVEFPELGGLAAMTVAAVTGGLSWLFGRLGRVEEAVD